MKNQAHPIVVVKRRRHKPARRRGARFTENCLRRFYDGDDGGDVADLQP